MFLYILEDTSSSNLLPVLGIDPFQVTWFGYILL